jgi:hypothetical protein
MAANGLIRAQGVEAAPRERRARASGLGLEAEHGSGRRERRVDELGNSYPVAVMIAVAVMIGPLSLSNAT